MEFDITGVIKDFEGNPIETLDPRDKKKVIPLNIRKVLLDLCDASFPDERITGEEKILNFKLGLKIAATEKTAHFTTDEVVKIKNLSKKYNPIIIAGRIIELLEPTDIHSKEEKDPKIAK